MRICVPLFQGTGHWGAHTRKGMPITLPVLGGCMGERRHGALPRQGIHTPCHSHPIHPTTHTHPPTHPPTHVLHTFPRSNTTMQQASRAAATSLLRRVASAKVSAAPQLPQLPQLHASNQPTCASTPPTHPPTHTDPRSLWPVASSPAASSSWSRPSSPLCSATLLLRRRRRPEEEEETPTMTSSPSALRPRPTWTAPSM